MLNRFHMYISKEDLDLIEEARKKEGFPSKSSYIRFHVLKAYREQQKRGDE